MTVDSGLAPREGTPYGGPDPKPEKRIVDVVAMRRFRKNSAPVCQVCGKPWPRYAMSIHHIVPRSQGGDDVEANFAYVDGHGSSGCHGCLESRRNGARFRLRQVLSQAQVDYVVAKKGQAWLDRHYPVSAVSDRSPVKSSA